MPKNVGIFCRYDNFGAPYHCFLQLNTNLLYGILIPMIIFTIITFSIVEAAGGAAEYKKVGLTFGENDFGKSN